MNSSIKLAAFLLLYIFSASCSTSYKDEIALIPKESKMVAQIDINRVLDKSGALDFNFDQVKGFLEKQGKNEGASFLEALVMNFSKTGISRKSKAFYYLCPFSRRKDLHGFVVKLSSPSEFEDFLNDFGQQFGGEVAIKKNALFDQAKFANMPRLVVAWNSNSAMAVMPEKLYLGAQDRDKFIADIFTMKKNDQISNVKSFNAFIKQKDDASAYISPPYLRNIGPELGLPGLKSTQRMEEGDYGEVSLNFGQGTVDLLVKAHINNSDTSSVVLSPVDPDLLAFCPSNGWFSIASHIQTDQQSRRYRRSPLAAITNPSSFFEATDLSSLERMSHYGQLEPEMVINMSAMEKREIIKENRFYRYYGGEETPMVYDTFENEVPVFQAVFKLVEPADSTRERVKNDLQYFWTYDSVKEVYSNNQMEMGLTYLYLRDNLMFITNDAEYLDNILEDKPFPSMADVNNEGLYTEINLKKIFAPENIEALDLPESEDFVLAYDKIYEVLDALRIMNQGQNGLVVQLQLTDEENNSLYQLVEAAKEVMEFLRTEDVNLMN
jgi:hypothetical protein